MAIHPPRRHRLAMVVAAAMTFVMITLSTGVALAAANPDTIIDSGPANGSVLNASSATFTFHATKSGSTFACRLGASGSYTPCTSPQTYATTAEGSYSFSVRATWRGRTDSSPATSTWKVDTINPTMPTNLQGSALTATSVRLTWTAGTDTNLAGYDIVRDGAPVGATTGTQTTFTDLTVAGGNTYSYQVRTRDAAGNVSSLTSGTSVTVPIPPQTTIDAAPSGGTQSRVATISFSSDMAGATFTCKLDAGLAAACTNPNTYTGLAEGVHTFSVFATFGVADPTPATAIWTIDQTPPSAPTGLAASVLSPTSTQLTWTAATDNTGVTGYNIVRDGLPLATIGVATTYTDGTVPVGTYPAYRVQAFDIAGNSSVLTAPVSAPVPGAPFNPALTRMPYLTDLTGLSVIVNFATDRSAGATGTASVRFGPLTGGSCQLTTTVPASKIAIAVGTVLEYQWKANLALPATGPYCYRTFLGATDLLAANASPTFQTQVPVGSAESFSFAVFGDWGQTDASGANPYQAGVMSQIAASGVRFAVTTGDNGYPSGAQADYGDIQQPGSGVFGMPFWGGVGANLAVFPIIGNHGFSRIDAFHPHFVNWPQDAAVTSSGGAARMTAYPSINGSTPATLPDSWYAFSAGNARFYMLTATWADLNVGSGTAYSEDYLAHWAATAPEYQWLQADLAAHPSGLKFAFFHYPLYSDQWVENGDTYLQGNSSLEGLLASNGVNLGFSGHAHTYQRNSPATGTNRQSLVTYVTGGGGGQAQSTGTCSSNDQYAVGWSYTNNHGTVCGAAPVPTSPAQVHHFLKVTINGNTVTVTPTDSTGQTFDVQTYTFTPKPDTFIDSGPATGSNSSSATFTFHASSTTATYTCKLDAGIAGTCTSPKSYTGLGNGAHTFTVQATVGGVLDPVPASYAWTVDTIAPTTPGSFAAGATSPFSIALSWAASTDNFGVTGYDVYRDGSLLTTMSPATGYTDAAVLGSETHTYSVRARDLAGNVSAPTGTIQVTTPAPPVPLFTDGFESGTLNAWAISNGGFTVQGATVHGGAFAVEGNTTTGATFAKAALPGSFAEGYARTWFLVASQTDQINLLRLRSSTDVAIGYVYIATSGQLGFHNDATGANTLSATVPGPGWHALELHVLTGASGAVDIWLDNVRIADLSGTGINTGAATIGRIQIGDTQTGRTYDVVFDDVAFGTSRLGPKADSGPTTPVTTSTASDPYKSVTLTWTASTDDIGVVGYDVYRDGSLVGNNVNVLSYFDPNVLASTTYSYTVQARDTSGNLSAMSAPAMVMTPAAQAPVFADGFESGNASAWTAAASSIQVLAGDTRTGTYAAEANTLAAAAASNVRKALPSTYADAYARVAFKLKNQNGKQIALLRLRQANSGLGTQIAYVYVASTGTLYFRSSAESVGRSLGVSPGSGWHVLELHVIVAGASSTVEVWFDGSLLTLSGGTPNLGTAPVGQFDTGDSVSVAADVVYDDAAFGTARLGPVADAPPSAPTITSALAISPTSVNLEWSPSTDDIGVTGYDVYRNGTLRAGNVSALSWTDGVSAGATYTYTVQARDTSGNLSPLSDPAVVNVPTDNPPSTPANVVASPSSPYAVHVAWDASMDDTGVAGYDVYRDDSLVVSTLGVGITWTDTGVAAATTYSYEVQARDTSGNLSARSAAATVTTPPPPDLGFLDGFESGDLSAWSSSTGVTIQGTDVNSGLFAAECDTTNGKAYAQQSLGGSLSDVYGRVYFKVKSQGSQFTLLGFRSGKNLAAQVYLSATGKIGVPGSRSSTTPSVGVWHALEFHLQVNGAASTIEVWLDGTPVGLTPTVNLGSTSTVDGFQIGDTQSRRTFDVIYDDVAFGTSRIGL